MQVSSDRSKMSHVALTKEEICDRYYKKFKEVIISIFKDPRYNKNPALFIRRNYNADEGLDKVSSLISSYFKRSILGNEKSTEDLEFFQQKISLDNRYSFE